MDVLGVLGGGLQGGQGLGGEEVGAVAVLRAGGTLQRGVHEQGLDRRIIRGMLRPLVGALRRAPLRLRAPRDAVWSLIHPVLSDLIEASIFLQQAHLMLRTTIVLRAVGGVEQMLCTQRPVVATRAAVGEVWEE